MSTHFSTSLDQLISSFNDQTLPASAWTHEAHLSIGIVFVYRYGFAEAVCRLRAGIILLNRVQQTENSGQKGYHETLTVFWAKVIEAYRIKYSGASVEELVKDFLSSPLADRRLPFLAYEKSDVLSISCRAVYKEETLRKVASLVDEEVCL